MTQLKTCKECGKTREIKDFYKEKSGAGGRRAICKDCCRKKWYKHRGPKILFYDMELLRYAGKRKCEKVKMCGYQVGLLIHIRSGELVAYSCVKGFKMCKSPADGKLFLYNQIVKAGITINKILTDQAKKIADRG